jgi:hypothetical protein
MINNDFHDNGDMTSQTDNDNNGLQIGDNTYNIWVLDSRFWNLDGTGIQVIGNTNTSIHHVYIGRNLVYNTRQSGAWTKGSSDCIFSQNEMYGIQSTPWGALGTGIGFQYGPERTWIIFNHLHHQEYGVGSGSNSVPDPGQNTFVIGNVIHDIYRLGPPQHTDTYSPTNPWHSAGVMLVGGVNLHVHNNTIYNSDAGVNIGISSGSAEVTNNIISNVDHGNHIFIEDTGTSSGTYLSSVHVDNNLLYQGGGQVKVRYQSSTFTTAGAINATYNSHASGLANIFVNPLFANLAAADVRLQSSSPAINAGSLPAAFALYESLYGVNINVDMDGHPRIGTFDIGAYEY